MFSDPVLFSKPFNVVQSPNMTWSEMTKIRCQVNLHLGLDETLTWDKNHAPTLGKILHLYNQINNSPPNDKELRCYQMSLNYRMINFYWRRLEDYRVQLKIGVQFYKYQETTVLIKTINGWANSTNFKLSVFRQLLKETPKTVRNKYGELLFRNRKKFQSKFRIGDYVRTVTGLEIKTQREGFVIETGYHNKYQCFIYQLFIGEKKNTTWYRENQLISIEKLYNIK